MEYSITLPGLWFSTQLGAFVCSIFSLSSFFSFAYIVAYLFIVLSLILSLYQSLKSQSERDGQAEASTPESSIASPITIENTQQILDFLKSLLPLLKLSQTHPTTPYILLSLSYLLVFPKYLITLVPYTIFSFFHILKYIRTFVVARLPLNENLQEKIKTGIDYITENYNTLGFQMAVWTQLAIFATICLSTLVNIPLNLIGYGDGHTFLDVVCVLVWFSFLNAVQSDNLLMKDAINRIVAIVDGFVMDPSTPPQVKHLWNRTKHIIKYKDLNHAE